MPFSTGLPPENTDPWYAPLGTAWAALTSFVNGLEASIASLVTGKANTVHTHAASDVTSGTFNVARIPDLAQSKVTGLGTALAAKADLVDGGVPTSQIPAIAITEFLGAVASQAAMLALTGQKGDWATRTDNSTTWIITGDTPSSLASWTQIQAPTGGGGAVSSVNGQTGIVTLGAGDVGARPAGNVPWDEVSSKPTTFAPVIGSGAGDAVAGNDTRLTNERVPSPNSVDNTKVADGALSIAKTNGLQTALDGKVTALSAGAALWQGPQATYDGMTTPRPAGVYVV